MAHLVDNPTRYHGVVSRNRLDKEQLLWFLRPLIELDRGMRKFVCCENLAC